MHQMELDAPLMTLARNRGAVAGEACAAKAERDGEFSVADAQRFVVCWLARHGAMSGEALVDAAIAHGHKPHDKRAFGTVLAGLSRRGAIRCIRADLPRGRGNGTSGGKLWELV